VTFPYVPAFLLLLAAYMVYSEWARLDSRYLIAGALVLLVATALVDAAGSTDLANTLAEFVFFLLAGGVLLLLVDHLRGEPREGDRSAWSSGPRPWHPHTPEAPQEVQAAPDQTFERSQ
jgi:peptidoglycan/LPS O-acetylase OafA/YrhL